MARMVMMVLCVALACMVVAAPYAEAAITCGTVVSKLSSCLAYLRGSPTLPPACCSGIKSLNSAAKSTPDRQTVCGCLKSAASSGINPSLAAGLPGKCGVSVPYKISPSTDCSKVH